MKVKFFNKQLLDKVNKRAIANNYNRAVVQEFIDSLPDDMHFPVTLQLVHEHAAGVPVAPHMRCRVMTGKSIAGPFTSVFVDVEMGMFELLPEVEIPDPPKANLKGNSAPNFSVN